MTRSPDDQNDVCPSRDRLLLAGSGSSLTPGERLKWAKCGPSCCTAAKLKPVSPTRSKADLNFFENWVKLLQCKGLEDTQKRQ